MSETCYEVGELDRKLLRTGDDRLLARWGPPHPALHVGAGIDAGDRATGGELLKPVLVPRIGGPDAGEVHRDVLIVAGPQAV